MSVRPTTTADPNHNRRAVLEIILQDEAHDEGMTVYLDPDDAMDLGSFLSNVEQKLDRVHQDGFTDWDG